MCKTLSWFLKYLANNGENKIDRRSRPNTREQEELSKIIQHEPLGVQLEPEENVADYDAEHREISRASSEEEVDGTRIDIHLLGFRRWEHRVF